MSDRTQCLKARWYHRPAFFLAVMALALFSRWQKGLVPLVPLVRNSAGDLTERADSISPALRANLQNVLHKRRIRFWTDADGTIFIRRWCSWDKASIADCTAEAIRLTTAQLSPEETMLLHAHRR